MTPDKVEAALGEAISAIRRAVDGLAYRGKGANATDEDNLRDEVYAELDPYVTEMEVELATLTEALAELQRERNALLADSLSLADRLADSIIRSSRAEADCVRLDYIERTFSGMTNRERYLPVQMIWGKGAMGRTLREACDKHMNRDAAMKETP